MGILSLNNLHLRGQIEVPRFGNKRKKDEKNIYSTVVYLI